MKKEGWDRGKDDEELFEFAMHEKQYREYKSGEAKRRFNQGKTPHLFFYRDNAQKEVDLIEEQSFDQLYTYEIKSAKRYNTQFAAGLDYFRKLYGSRVLGGEIIYDGVEQVESNGYTCRNWQLAVL